MKLSLFTERLRTTQFDITDEAGEKLDEIEVTYRPATWTPEFEERMSEEGARTTIFAAALAEAVSSWSLTEDVTDDAGNVGTVEMPHTAERLRKIPTNLLVQIVGGISADMRPKARSSGS